MNLNETIYGNSYLLGRNVHINGEHRIENIAFDKYLRDSAHLSLYFLNFIKVLYNYDLKSLKDVKVVASY